MPPKPPIFWSSLLFTGSLLTSALIVILGAFSLAEDAIAENELNLGIQLALQYSLLYKLQQTSGAFTPAGGEPANAQHFRRRSPHRPIPTLPQR